MKNRFTIGQMAKLHNIPIKTLRYYHEIGLFNPIEVDAHNGYRYYSTEQFERLDTINYLKVLGIPLKEIKTLLEVSNIDFFLAQLEKQKEITENRIRELTHIKHIITERIKEVQKASAVSEVGTVFIRNIGERKIFRLKQVFSSEHELEMYLRTLENQLSKTSTLFIGKVGLTVSMDNIKKNKFQEYNSVFIQQEVQNCDNDLVDILPEARYACIYYRGDHSQSTRYYRKILDYLLQTSYEIAGDSIERTMIDEYISKNPDDYLTEIQIPVKKI